MSCQGRKPTQLYEMMVAKYYGYKNVITKSGQKDRGFFWPIPFYLTLERIACWHRHAYPKGLKCMDNHWFLFFTLYFPPYCLHMHLEEPLLCIAHIFVRMHALETCYTISFCVCERWRRCYLAPQNCVWILPLQMLKQSLFLETYLGLDNKTWGMSSWQGLL